MARIVKKGATGVGPKQAGENPLNRSATLRYSRRYSLDSYENMSCRSCCEYRVAIYVEYPQVSGYPSDGQAANVSLDTTTKEVLEVIGIEKEEAKLQNIDIMFGSVNAIEYCTTMMKFPTLEELEDMCRENICRKD